MKQIINTVRLHARGQAARTAKALAVKESARQLLVLWAAEVSGFRGANFYMHIAYHHLPDVIERLPCDILQASGDSFEAKNQELKRRLRRSANQVSNIGLDSVVLQEHKQTQGSKQGLK